MAWNPEKYDQFKDIRYQPFFDLMELISGNDIKNGIDIGCGTGELTSILSKKFDDTNFLGIDPSPEMLANSNVFESSNLHFKQCSVEDFLASDAHRNWDHIFSNAALQWSDNHETLFPGLIAHLSEHGQFAVQMPVQKENLLNRILIELIQEKPFNDFLHGWKRASPLLSIDAYAQIMFCNGLNKIQIIQKVYPLIADNTKKLFDFISGSSLIPYLERMLPHEQELFAAAYKIRIQKAFKKYPAIYAFKRLLLYGCKTKQQ